MKVGIVTVFYTENCGSILQATALKDTLELFGCEVFFVDTRNKLSGHSINRLLKKCAKSLLRREVPISEIKEYIYYNKYIKKNFCIVGPEEALDRVVIGSDTVWDIASDYFLLSQDVFWGGNLACKKISSYAASIANSSYEVLDSLGYPVKMLKQFDRISVRDKYTKEYVDQYINSKAMLVCDPTLLQTKEYYLRKAINVRDNNYILLYLFDEPDFEASKKIREFAKVNGCKLVSIVCLGKRIRFADKYVESTVDNFLGYFSNAKYVITNTFHGTVFSVIFNKQFVVLDYKKQKIYEFLHDLELHMRITKDDISSILSRDIDYSIINRNIEMQREQSLTYITHALDLIYK